MSDKSAGSRFAQPKAGPQGAAQEAQRKGKYKRAWTSEGPYRSGTEDKLHLQKGAPNTTFAASLPTHSHPSAIDWCNMQASGRQATAPPRIVESLDLVKYIGSGFRSCPMVSSIYPLSFQKTEKAFHCRIIGAAADSTHTADQIMAVEEALVLAIGKLAAAV